MTLTLAERIDAAYAAEQADPRPPLTRADIPRAYEAITDAWLTDVVCRHVPGAAVIAHRLGPHDDGTNNRRRIHLTYNPEGAAAGLPASVFCKATFGLANRQMLGHSGGVLCEVTFHNEARPLLDIEAPRALLAAYDPVGFASIVVFEDFGEDATFCSEDTAVDADFARAQLDILARLHGRFHAAPELAGSLAVLPTWYERFHNLATFHLEESCEAGVDEAEAFLPPELFARRSEIWGATLRSLDALRPLPLTLCHGDVHLKNWYVRTGGTLGLGDWGVAHRGHWSRDLAYTLCTALTVENRRAWEHELVGYYLDRLAAEGGPRVAMDEAMRTFRLALPSAFAFWTLTLKPDPAFPDMQPAETARVFIERLGAAMHDHAALDAV
ncbi:phosphotransferase [Novosphingobium lentum]|uniref:phosphotransferase n=1 Tax=Novosphingobium lentum TaxID=145287 RepID=UPI00082B1364|nr:phosphotransferase [Novosphingobium lentum]